MRTILNLRGREGFLIVSLYYFTHAIHNPDITNDVVSPKCLANDVMICMYILHSFPCTDCSGYCIIFFPSGHHYLITFEKSLIKTGHLSNANILGKWLCCFAFASTRDD